ncbi:MAG: site-2 protease family protein [candidate division Zixibacteria bacterium]|nr:site-2 protease family protein [candidate division Zixibacteria bacterium]
MFAIDQIIVMIPPFLFAITIHEFSHGWMAMRLGDPTAKMAGRLTLNPLYHLDVFGTLMLFIAGFGWAKPVPVNPYNLRDPIKDQVWISIAGPASNLISALFFGLIIRMIDLNAILLHNNSDLSTILVRMLIFSLQLNIILAVFNLIPIPPLDGSHILRGLIPRESLGWYRNIERFGPFILIGIILLGSLTGFSIFGLIFAPFIRIFAYLFAGIAL